VGNQTILIVEDAETCAATLEMALASAGHAVLLASNTRQALAILAAGDVAAVITDLNMPAPDGFELIRRIRANGNGRPRLPIIVTSGDTDPRTPARTAELGADAFFSKPYSPTLVRQKLEQLLHAAQLADKIL
jgi:CheY-like chemotaxis protein